MSIHVMGWVFRESEAKLGDRLVLLILADKAEDDGTNARPSVPTIARQACLSERQVQRCLRNLEGAGAITKTGTYRYPGQRNGVNIYQVVMPANGDILSVKGDIHDSQTVTPMSPNPSLEPPKEQTLAAAPRDPLLEAPPFTAPRGGVRIKNAPTKAQRDEVWDALTDIFGPALTRSAEQHRGKHVASLAEAGATRDEIFARAKRWPLHFENATLTAAALEKHWDTLNRKPLRRTG